MDGGPNRWLAFAVAQVLLGLLVVVLYYTAAFVSPLIFRKSYSVDTGRERIDIRRGATQKEVLDRLGKPRGEQALAVKGFREWVYQFDQDGKRVYRIIFQGEKLDAVVSPGQRRPVPWTRSWRGRR